ncbi:hypothetical protein AB0M86_41550 [Streptomyces sp. NPDC051639]|uniref:hypothetical protein n=1 Tax=Streptomyces sp. NPDC051639 TaxID=3155671 RepID=UPI00342708EE
MTTPPVEGLLFDVAAPPTPVERLLLLADQYVQHNDMIDRLLRAGPSSEPDVHVASAQQLAAATRAAIKAVTDERLFQSHELSDAVVRLQQLAFLSSASADHGLHMARTLTALAPEAAMACADTLAYEIRHRRLQDERVHLTADGCHGLAAAFGRPRAPALTAARSASSPVTSTARAATR